MSIQPVPYQPQEKQAVQDFQFHIYWLQFDTDNSIPTIYFCVIGKEFWSINSPTLSCRKLTISANTKTCVSSKSCMINFFPRAFDSSKYSRNCFMAGSLWKQEENYGHILFIYLFSHNHHKSAPGLHIFVSLLARQFGRCLQEWFVTYLLCDYKSHKHQLIFGRTIKEKSLRGCKV